MASKFFLNSLLRIALKTPVNMTKKKKKFDRFWDYCSRKARGAFIEVTMESLAI